jgi:type I restriction enzyme S subunit
MSRWPTSKLGELCVIRAGGTPSRSNSAYFGGSIPWVKIGDLKQGVITTTEERLTEAGLDNCSAHVLPVGTILISIFATIGRCAILGIDAATNQAIAGLTPQDRTSLCGEYLRFFLESVEPKLRSQARGVAQPNINKRILTNLDIPVPPIQEQRRIVDILNRAAGIRRLRLEAQEKARQLKRALFIEMFGNPAPNEKKWPLVTVGDVLHVCDYGTSTKAKEEPEGIPILRMGNVTTSGELVLDDLKYVELTPTDYEKYRLEYGDLLFNRTNSKDLVGKTGIWDDRFDAVAASYFIRLRVDHTRANPWFLWAFLNTTYMKRRLFETARGAIGQSNINAKELADFQIYSPPLPMQNAFAERLAEIQAMIAQQERAAETAKTLSCSLKANLLAA